MVIYVLGHIIAKGWCQVSNPCLFELLTMTFFCPDFVYTEFYNSSGIYSRHVLQTIGNLT